MKVTRKAKMAAVVLALSLVPLIGVAVKAGAATPRVTNDRTLNKGTVAIVSATSEVPKTCSNGVPGTDRTGVTVVGSENITRADGTKVATTELFVSVAKIDSCGPFGTILFGTLVNPPVYEQRKTDSARMAGTVSLQDGNGTDVGGAVVDVILTSTGQASKGSTLEQFSTQGERVQIRQSGFVADASATGSVTLNGQNLLAGSEVRGTLGTNAIGTVVVTKVRP